MAIFSKVLAAAAFVQTRRKQKMLRNMLSDIAVLLCLVLVASVLGGILIIGLLGLFYLTLVAEGVNSVAALAATLAVVLVTLIVLIRIAYVFASRISNASRNMYRINHPAATKVTNTFQAFIDGFNGVAANETSPHSPNYNKKTYS